MGLQNSQIRATSRTTFGEIFSGKYHWKLLLTGQKSLLVCVVVWMLLSNQIFELKWNGGNGCGSGLLGATSNKQGNPETANQVSLALYSYSLNNELHRKWLLGNWSTSSNLF